MQQKTDLRKRWNPRAQWVQLGVLSATVVTPLLSRWNELRTAERARALREEAEERLRGARALLPGARLEARRQLDAIVRQATEKVNSPTRSRRLSSTLWLAGASVGLAVAGVTAYIVVKRQLDVSSTNPLVILPAPSHNGHDARHSPESGHGSRRAAPSPATTSAPAADSAVAALAEQANATDTADMPTTPPTTPATGAAPMGIEDPADAKFIGNIRTLVYHEADAENLPAEENRVYFASEDEASLAGYRRDRDEVASEPDAQAQANN